jgi:hypothetical protein
MNPSMPPAIQHLFQVSTLEAVSREQLEKFVEEYPCFGFGHYLLSRKLRAENADQFLTATRKTSLYFPNPFWLQWMLENAEPVHAGSPVHFPESAPAESPIYDAEPPFVLDETDQPGEFEPALVSADPRPEMESPETPAETTTLHSDPEAPTIYPEVPALDQEGPSSAAELLLESIEKAKALRESIQKINEDLQLHNGQPAPVAPEQPIADSPDPVVIAESPTPTIIAESAPIFEPMHTIDYFASQGIRLSLDENPTDTLGRQLKSFTEWLRTMRRLPQKDREMVPDRVAEQTVQNFAAHSIEGKEPVTETMAEVLAKQGMPERARIVYEKLSLLNPDKSAYFAAKIEQLNIH